MMSEPLNSLPLPQLFDRLVDASWLQTLVTAARDEDLGDRGDITSNVALAADRAGQAWFGARRAGVVAGLPVLAHVIKAYDGELELDVLADDGERVEAGQRLAAARGPLRAILAAERVMLNFLTRLSGIATLTGAYVLEVAGTAAQIYDTRKTLPGWRGLEKYAVRCGGGYCHRLGLYDAVLIKDNHIARVGIGELGDALRQAVGAARKLQPPPNFVEVEVDRLEQLDIALTCG
ncbi:MAG: nicotinate-nucleotide diphosphorylase (carboxylating), partial [Phycisphaerae bacterium]|nr:nicotinate-nucleotide diphosphorylase (carboxylating) [Phycisphaerae bacterium]